MSHPSRLVALLDGLYPGWVTTPGKGSPRLARAGVLALLTVLISVGGHALGGGTVHLSLPMLIGGAALGALCVAAADVRRSFVEILFVVLMAQPVLHLLASMGGHGADSAVLHVTPAMALGHLGAALVVSVLLADAERAFWTLAGLFAPVRLPAPAPVCRCAPAVVSSYDDSPTPLISRTLSSTVSRRGPPMVLGAR